MGGKDSEVRLEGSSGEDGNPEVGQCLECGYAQCPERQHGRMLFRIPKRVAGDKEEPAGLGSLHAPLADQPRQGRCPPCQLTWLLGSLWYSRKSFEREVVFRMNT